MSLEIFGDIGEAGSVVDRCEMERGIADRDRAHRNATVLEREPFEAAGDTLGIENSVVVGAYKQHIAQKEVVERVHMDRADLHDATPLFGVVGTYRAAEDALDSRIIE